MSAQSKFSPISINSVSEKLKETDDFDLALIAVMVTSIQDELTCLQHMHEDLSKAINKEEKNRRHYVKKTANRKRQRECTEEANNFDVGDGTSSVSKFPSWETIRDGISDRLFRRKYRMSKVEFETLCSKIKNKIGEDKFRSTNSQALCGYLRVAIGLRLLCGGSYLDLIGRAYGVDAVSSVYNYFHTFIGWVDETFEFPWIEALKKLSDGDESVINYLKTISADFAADSDGIFVGCIGALDGLAIRIKCPSSEKDPGNYFSRKNFYALNVQAICDKQKRILWISPGHKGATHDSMAWAETKLRDLLDDDLYDVLKKHGFFIVGDSAYPLSPYLQVPYSDAEAGTQYDAYNFWLSNSRIQIECTFGEFIARFGLFWRTMQFGLVQCCDIINAAAKLHNFLVDSREGTDAENDNDYFRNLSHRDIIRMNSNAVHEEENDDDYTFPLVTDNNEPKPAGRPTREVREREVEGEVVRSQICNWLYANDHGRPQAKRMKYNHLGHAYFE